MITMNYIKTAQILTYLGVLPLICISSTPFIKQTYYIFAFKLYAVLILSFLGGINWGLGLRERNSYLLILSVIPALFGWFIFLINDELLFLSSLIPIFILQLFIDHVLHNAKIIENWFLRLRSRVTFLVIISIIIFSFSL